MPLPSSPDPISASQIRNELFDNNPVSLSEFQGDRVWNGSSFENLPSGQISYGNFRGRSYAYSVDILLVGGGGGGGNGGGDGAGGGGGGGQLKILTNVEMRNTGETVFVDIGNGGVGAPGQASKGSTGETTTFTGYGSAAGGGGGSTNSKDGAAGCSGGGGGAEAGANNIGNGGTSNCGAGGGGNNGGYGSQNDNTENERSAGGGGGGYGADDLSPDSNATPTQSGYGRRGYNLDNFMGSSARTSAGLNSGVAGGGGGAQAGTGSRGQGRDGGGQGAGFLQRLPDQGIDGTGGGGGGGTNNLDGSFDDNGTPNPDGARGGNGLVIVRYSKSNPSGQVGGGGNVYSDDNYYYHVFTSDTNYTM